MNYKCLLCGRGFYFHKSYLKHSAVKHTQECEFCDLSFATTRYKFNDRLNTFCFKPIQSQDEWFTLQFLFLHHFFAQSVGIKLASLKAAHLNIFFVGKSVVLHLCSVRGLN